MRALVPSSRFRGEGSLAGEALQGDGLDSNQLVDLSLVTSLSVSESREKERVFAVAANVN